MPKVVQFTHPGPEHGPDQKNGSHKSWNTGNHRRKFMLCQGQYVLNDNLEGGKLMFWGEWEPPSFVERFDAQSDKFHPEWLHKPYLPADLPGSEGYQTSYQNTDPYVFGECFRYFVCKQFKPKRRRLTSLARLNKGSVILFGSTGNQNTDKAFFQLDTVFVVADYVEYDIADPHALDIPGIGNYRDVVYKMAFPVPSEYSMKLRLYYGATWDNPFEGMYSFAPSKAWEDPGFGFPRLHLKDIDNLTNNLNAAPKFTELPLNKMKEFWKEIRDISREQGYVEGVKFEYYTELDASINAIKHRS